MQLGADTYTAQINTFFSSIVTQPKIHYTTTRAAISSQFIQFHTIRRTKKSHEID